MESGAQSSKPHKVRSLLHFPRPSMAYSHYIKRRKTSTKPRDASTPAASTTAESVRNLIKKNPRYSKRINYDALKDLFVDMEEDKKDLYTMDRTPDPDMMVIEEEGGAVGVHPPSGGRGAGEETDGVADTDADEGSERGFVLDTGWDDVYEQEV